MPKSISVEKRKQADLVMFVNANYDNFKDLMKAYREKMLGVYEGYATFKQKKQADRQTTFKVNKAYEVVNKILPRVMAKDPKWIVSVRTDEFRKEDKKLSPEERMDKMKDLHRLSRGIQDYLTYIFDRYGLREVMRLWAKNMIIYGNSYAKVRFKYEMSKDLEYEVRVDGENKIKEEKITETITGEYPTIEIKSWTDMYYDPRYVLFEDMPGIIEETSGVRIAQLEAQKERYMNLDKLKRIPEISQWSSDQDSYKKTIQQITGIDTTDMKEGVDKNSMKVKTYYGFYTYKGKEKLYLISTVADLVLLEFREITHIPLEDIKCFEDTETHFSTGFVEPILGLQEEMNFKKNSASQYITGALNRSWVRSPNSGVNPKDLISKPGNIITTSKDAVTALENITELPHRPLPFDYFQEQNDIERQVQSLTFTVDTSNPRSQQALTNTATGARIKFFESNSVIDEIRKHFEEGLEKIAYKLLQSTYENMEENIVIKKMGEKGFWEISRELLRDALRRYSIKVEAGSSSFDSVEARREDAIAFYTMAIQAKQAGVEIDLKEAFKDMAQTFEKKNLDKFLKEDIQTKQQDILSQIMGQGGQGGGGGGGQLPTPGATPGTDAAALTEQVAKGGLTAGI